MEKSGSNPKVVIFTSDVSFFFFFPFISLVKLSLFEICELFHRYLLYFAILYIINV